MKNRLQQSPLTRLRAIVLVCSTALILLIARPLAASADVITGGSFSIPSGDPNSVSTVTGGSFSIPTDNQNLTWYWSQQHAADAVHLWIEWAAVSRHDNVQSDTCWGIGHALRAADGTLEYRHFYCAVTTTNTRPYAILLHVTGQSTDTVDWDQNAVPTTWYWPSQLVANALVAEGIQWPQGHDSVSNDRCTSFGPAYGNRYQHFYCAVTLTNGAAYAVVVHVLDNRTYRVTYVGDDPTPAVEKVTPAPGQNTAANRASVNAATPFVQGMILQSHDFSNQYRYGTEFPDGDYFP